MKKTALILLLSAAAFSMEAQTIYDALRFSENHYEGTARSLAMGNAFTALGGDLGGITINPAGSAVAKYSQITVSPGVNVSVNTAGGTALPGETTPLGFGNSIKNSWSRFNVPNFGVSMNFDTHRTSGIKNVSLGFVVNTTNRFQESLMTSGINNNTSITGALAVGAGGFNSSILQDPNAYYNGGHWSYITAIQSGMISPLTGSSEEYIGASEFLSDNGDIFVPGPLDQSYQRQTSGFKYDYVINLGFNISDFVYVGANLGITSFNYNSDIRYMEKAVNPADFENIFTVDEQDVTTYFNDIMYDYRYSATGAGVYGKFGIIVTPIKGLRLGAAIQTPTSTTISENWSESGSTTFDNPEFNASSESPVGEFKYKLISPFRANFGAAWTFGTFGLVSLDYEICDYSAMKFKEMNSMQSGEFEYQNADIKDFMGTSHMLRAGIELKPVPQFAIRAGYGLTTHPQKGINAYGDSKYIWEMFPNTMTHKGSFGLGYSSNGSFFADVACSYTKYADEYIWPYSIAYDGAEDCPVTPQGDYNDYLAPEILHKRNLWNIMLTIGFRF